MARPPREAAGDVVYHVLNRANARMQVFESTADYRAFEQVLAEAHQQVPMRTLAYCVMPNHWHFVLWPWNDGDLSKFMHWLTMTHVQRWHAYHETTGLGHLYQRRFRSIPIQSDAHYFTVCRYVERNALRANLVARAEDWPWSSLHRHHFGDDKAKSLLSQGPLPWPADWVTEVNLPQSQAEMDALRNCISRGRPFGTEPWVEETAHRLGLLSTLRPRGRPRKTPRA